MKSKYEVLHCHTTFSDGTMSHREVLDLCQEYDIGTVAFTDHDILLQDKVFKELKALNHTVKFISGIELSATTTPEVEGSIGSFHIIGLFVDHKNEALREFCDNAGKRRRERITFLVDSLKKVGFSITEEEVVKESPEGTIGRPHIVTALLKKEENVKLLEATLIQFKEAADREKRLKERYEETMAHDRRAQMFDLFLGDKPFVPGVYTHYLYKVTLDQGVKLIRDAGGIAILAHPSYYRDKLGADIIKKFAQEGRIDGIETVFALGDMLSPTFARDVDAFRAIIREYGLVAGGGGDFHTPDNFEYAFRNKIRMEETKSFLPRILAKYPEYKDRIY